MAEKRYESDMTRKEKRQEELKKLESMNFKGKVAYILEYYKWVFALIVVLILVINLGTQIYHNAQKIELLSIAVVDMNYMQEEGIDSLEADLLEKLGTGDKNEVITTDTSVTSSDDYNSSMKMMVVMATGSTDILICGDTTYDNYQGQEAFLTWEEILGDEYSKYEQYMTKGCLDLTKCKNWEKYDLVYYEPVYAAVVASSKQQENCIEFLKLMTE